MGPSGGQRGCSVQNRPKPFTRRSKANVAINDWSGRVIRAPDRAGSGASTVINRVAEPGCLSGVGERTQ